MAEPKPENPLYKGSCHCGLFKYEARINLKDPKPEFNGAIITKCNCTICHKTGAPLTAPDEGTFKILSPETRREGLSEYHFRDGNVHHYFCPKCGIKPLVEGSYTINGKTTEFRRINVLTLDTRGDGESVEEVKNMKTGYLSGRDDDWSKPIASEPYEGGAW